MCLSAELTGIASLNVSSEQNIIIPCLHFVVRI